MKKAVFRAGPANGGFIRSTLATIRDKTSRFGFWDSVEVVTLVLCVILVMRYLLAH